MLASDSRGLRRHLNTEVAGIPLIHTNQSRVIVLEPMSEKTRDRVKEVSLRMVPLHDVLSLTRTRSFFSSSKQSLQEQVTCLLSLTMSFQPQHQGILHIAIRPRRRA